MSTKSAGRDLFGRKELARLINPASVAVVGASPTAGSFGLRTLQNIDVGYAGRVYPINPKHSSILGRPCYASIKETPTVPDCVVLAIPRDYVTATLEQCAALGVGGAIIFSSGFGELGTGDGIRQQQAIVAIARASGMRILGPNCMGLINIASRIGLSFIPNFNNTPLVDGPIGIVSQSGALGYVLLQAMERGVGFSHYLSPGNSCDVDTCDLINYLIEDENTKAIGCTFEGVGDGERLIEASRRALAADKPFIVCKMGNSEISKRTALSHTGTLAGANAAYAAAFAQTGAIVVDDFEAILETACFFSKAGRPKAHGIGVMASSGGAAVMAADKAAEHAVELPPPAQYTSERLDKTIPGFGSSLNPADITAESLRSVAMYGECITAFAEDPAFGAVVVPMMSAAAPTTVDRAKYLCELGAKLGKPVCVVWLNEWYEGPGSEIYDGCASLSMFRSMERCFAALASWVDLDKRRPGLLSPLSARLTNEPNARDARALLAASSNAQTLTEREAKNILAAYGIKVTREKLATGADDSVKAAQALGYPVVMKAESAAIAHKTDAGVVKLNLKSDTDVRRAHDEIMAAVSRIPGSPKVDGISVQEMIAPGVEVMMGVRQDPQFGTLVVCGLGGIFVELLKDIAVALAPIDEPRAQALIRSLKGYPLLTGWRGSPRVDIEALAKMLCRLSELGVDLAQEIAEIDVNPVILDARGGVAVDALIVRTHGSAKT